MAGYSIPGADSAYVQAVREWWCVIEHHPVLPLDVWRARCFARRALAPLLFPGEHAGSVTNDAVTWLSRRYANLHSLSPNVSQQAVETALRYLIYGSPWHWACHMSTKNTRWLAPSVRFSVQNRHQANQSTPAVNGP